MDEYNDEERKANRAAWECFLSTTPHDGFNLDEVQGFAIKASDWNACAVGCMASREQRLECQRFSHHCGRVRAGSLSENEADALLAAQAPPLFLLGCAFELAAHALHDLLHDADEAGEDYNEDEAHAAVRAMRGAWNAVRAEVGA